MKLEFTRNGKPVTVTAADEDIVVAEMKTGSEDFVMIRCKPGSMSVSAEPDAQTWRL